MPKPRKWLRKILGDNSTQEEKKAGRKASEPATPPLPVLPSTRKHRLTPSSSLENLKPFIKPNGPFFEQLPPELRRQIYLAAFGDRTVHLDLRQEYPRLVEAPNAFFHAQVSEDGGERDHKTGPRWVWWSSVCHRHPMAPAWADFCQRGSPRQMCDAHYAGQWPDKCFVGVMGWILACRQS